MAGFCLGTVVVGTPTDRIVGLRVRRPAKMDFGLDVLGQRLHDRPPYQKGGLHHRAQRGGRYLSIRSTKHLARAGSQPSVDGVGDTYDNALAEVINGLYNTKLAHR